MVLIPSDGGRFEVEADGKLIWSKKETKEFPAYEDIVSSLN